MSYHADKKELAKLENAKIVATIYPYIMMNQYVLFV